MLQRLKLLKDLLGVSLHRRQGMAWLARIHASNFSEADRALVTRILCPMLRLPDNREHQPSAPDVPAPSAPAACRGQRPTT